MLLKIMILPRRKSIKTLQARCALVPIHRGEMLGLHVQFGRVFLLHDPAAQAALEPASVHANQVLGAEIVEPALSQWQVLEV